MEKEKILQKLFYAYYEARRNKRNTINQIEFEYNFESNLIKLRQEIISGNYKVGKSIYFIQNHPVKREVFAGDFRDRVVHHLIYDNISPIFEKDFIYDSYSCRIGKGTGFGYKRLEKFIKSCSNNYTKDCYVLKLDISGYFMSMNKDILFKKIKTKIHDKLFIELIEKTIYNDPTKNSIFRGKKSDYIGLPKNKSLFFAKENSGLPIGNLTSQLFSNIYLADFDKYIKNELGCKYYGRYVDDFVIVHENKEFLVDIINKIIIYLKDNLGLDLHPNKIYLQHYNRGVLFLGSYIKPFRKYIRRRTIGYFYSKIHKLNHLLENNNNKMNLDIFNSFRSIINSYLGLLKHHKSYKIRKKILLNEVYPYFWNYFYISGGYLKVLPKIKHIKT